MSQAPQPGAADQQPVFSQLFGLAAPIIGLNVLNVLALAVDTAMCGRLPQAEDALTALGFATQVIFLLMVAMIGLTVGTVAQVARAFGARQYDRVNHILHQSSMYTILLSVALAVLGNLLAPVVLQALGASERTLPLALDYLRPLLTGTVFNYLVVLYGAVLRGVGNTRMAFVVALVINVLNVIFNYGLILGNYGLPSLGVQGAAFGTLMAQAIGMIFFVGLLWRGVIPNLKLRLTPSKLDRELGLSLVRIGTPAAFDMVILNAAFMAIVGMLGRIEEVAVAAHGVGLRIQALAFVPGMSVSQATGALVGQSLGAGNIERTRRIVRASIILSTAIMSTLAAIIILAASPIVSIFDVAPDTRLHELAVVWMRVLGYGMPLVGVYIAFVGMLQGAGETRTSLSINVFVTMVLQIPGSYILGFPLEMGAYGVWLAFPLSFIFKAVLGAWVYKRGKWAKTGDRA